MGNKTQVIALLLMSFSYRAFCRLYFLEIIEWRLLCPIDNRHDNYSQTTFTLSRMCWRWSIPCTAAPTRKGYTSEFVPCSCSEILEKRQSPCTSDLTGVMWRTWAGKYSAYLKSIIFDKKNSCVEYSFYGNVISAKPIWKSLLCSFSQFFSEVFNLRAH
jgi:hypothetical protein